MYITLQKKKENIVYVNNGRVMVVVSFYKSWLTMEKKFIDKGILKN